MPGPKRQIALRYPLATVLTISLFATWGFANRIHDTVAPQFNRYFELSTPQAMLSYASFGLSYLFLAIPAALFLRRVGYKLGLVMGLAMLSLGALLLYPAVTQHEAMFYVAAVIATGSGWAFLETSANPLMLTMGSAETAIRRLNLAQTIYPLGLIIAYWLGRHLVLPSSHVADAQFLEANVRPYLVVGLVVLMLAFVIENVEFPKSASERSRKRKSAAKEIVELTSRPAFRGAMMAMAAFMTAMVFLWSVNGAYGRHAIPGISRAELEEFPLYIWIACTLGRAAATVLMTWVNPVRLLSLFAAAASLCPALALLTHGYVGVSFLIATSFFIGIMYPTIFGLAAHGLGSRTKIASGLMVTAAGFGMCVGTAANFTLTKLGAAHTTLAVTVLLFMSVLAFARYRERASTNETPNATADAQRAAQTAR